MIHKIGVLMVILAFSSIAFSYEVVSSDSEDECSTMSCDSTFDHYALKGYQRNVMKNLNALTQGKAIDEEKVNSFENDFTRFFSLVFKALSHEDYEESYRENFNALSDLENSIQSKLRATHIPGFRCTCVGFEGYVNEISGDLESIMAELTYMQN